MKNSFFISTLFMFLSLLVIQAQSNNLKMVKIRGVVLNADGMPIKNGDVFADSLKTGYRTNKKGEYKLRIPAGTDIISIYSELYGFVSEVYDGEKEINFKFSRNKEVIQRAELSELGYIFDEEVFRKIGDKSYAEYMDIYQIIREEFSGVIVNGSNIIVRGYIGGDQTPLFIVDGNYVSNIGNINPVDLKSIELLKGADTALYGARGAPGVFIITLK